MRSRMNGRPDVVFFTDRNLGRRFPEKLRAAGLQVERHDDHFGQLTTDSEWIAEVGQRGWVAVTRDARIRYSPLALETLMTSGARLLVIVGRLTTDEAAETFIRQQNRVVKLLRRENKPFIAKIRRDSVLIWLRKRDSRV